MPTFLPMFRSWHPKLSDEHKAAYEQILESVKQDLPEVEHKGIMHSLMELRLGSDLASLLTEYEEGDTENIHQSLEGILEQFRRDAGIKSLDFLRDDIGTLLQDEIDDTGLRWRLECLNASMRGLRWGDFGIIAKMIDNGGDVVRFVELAENLNFREAVERLGASDGTLSPCRIVPPARARPTAHAGRGWRPRR